MKLSKSSLLTWRNTLPNKILVSTKVAFWKLSLITPLTFPWDHINKLCQSGNHSFSFASFHQQWAFSFSGSTQKTNLMKKYITFDRIAYAMSLSTFIFIAVTLCAACIDLQNRTSKNQKQMQEEVRAMFASIEKPL